MGPGRTRPTQALAAAAGAGALNEDAAAFARHLAFTVRDNLSEIDRLIGELAIGWRLERMAVVDRNILRIGVAELVHSADVPVNVAINEAVELAKMYSTGSKAARFVNGILGELAVAGRGARLQPREWSPMPRRDP